MHGQDIMHIKLRYLDPLDRELVERALDSAWVAFKGNAPSGEFDGDEGARSQFASGAH
jgi:hypothetical protein